MSKILLKNIYTLVGEFSKEPLKGANLLIVDNKIEQISTSSIEVEAGTRVIDCGTSVVMPGLVNTHHHFYQTLTRNLPAVQNAKLFNWLLYLYEIWKNIDEEAIYYSSMLAMAELIKTGCTLSTDHHYLYPSGITADIMHIQFSAASAVGMRFSPTRGSMSLGKKDGGLPPDSVVQTDDQILSDSQRVITSYHDSSEFSMRKVMLAPCSPFSVTPNLMKQTALLARKYGVRLHTHLAETFDENEFCIKKYKKRPLDLMQECEFIGEDVSYAHGIHFSDDELEILSKHKVHIAHCPSSNMRLGSGICRVKEMIKTDINVALAVDGSASNDSSDMLGEVRNAMLLQRVMQSSDALSARQALEIATINGAKLLGYDKVGKLDTNWAADIAIFDLNSIGYAGSLTDPVAALIFSGYDHRARYVIINGRLVVDDKEFVLFDEEELIKRANICAQRLYDRANLGVRTEFINS